MIHLLLIADQHRLHDLFSDSAERPDTVVSIATSLDAGIELINSAPPNLVFVQSRLSGLSGEIIMRHVSGHLPATSQVILFSEGGKASFSDDLDQSLTLDLTLSDRQLSSDIRALIDKQLASNQPSQVVDQSLGAPAAEEFIPTPFVPNEPPADAAPVLVSPVPESPAAPPEPPAPQPTIANRFEAELDAELARREPSPAPEPIAADRPMTLAQLEGITAAAQESRPRAGASSPVRRAVPWLFAVAAVFVLVSAGGYLLGKRAADRQEEAPPPGRSSVKKAVPPAKPNPAPPAGAKPATLSPPEPTAKPAPAPKPAPTPVQAPPPAKPAQRPLPSFVSREGRDAGYSASHPGWERYMDKEREYKIFVERDSLKAIQVIDRSGHGLAPQLFSRAIQELAKVRDYNLASQEIKGEYLVKKGRLTPTSQVIIYKNKADNKLQAFVISFD